MNRYVNFKIYHYCAMNVYCIFFYTIFSNYWNVLISNFNISNKYTKYFNKCVAY